MQICEAFGANRYPFPEEPARQRQMNAEVTARLRELHTTIEAGQLTSLHLSLVEVNEGFTVHSFEAKLFRLTICCLLSSTALCCCLGLLLSVVPNNLAPDSLSNCCCIYDIFLAVANQS